MRLFRILDGKNIEVIEEESYRNKEIGGFGESTLQEILCEYPEIIPGEEINKQNSPQFLVIRREAGVTAGSIDLLLIDGEGIPTVIETKLIDNREIRRSVLAQGLEYIAHLKSEWNSKRIIEEGRQFWSARGGDFEIEFVNRLGFSITDDFLRKIDSNLNTNKIRLLIVADEIPSELTRIIEFLNDASQFDVFGIEVRLFASKDKKYKMLAPHLIGFTETTKEKKEKNSIRWDKERFFNTLASSSQQEKIVLAERLLVFGKELTNREVEWGVGKERGSFTVRLVLSRDERFSLFSVYTTGHFSINIGWNANKFRTSAPDLSETYRKRVLNELGIDLNQTSWEKGWPEADLSTLESKVDLFEIIMTDFVNEVKSKYNIIPIA